MAAVSVNIILSQLALDRVLCQAPNVHRHFQCIPIDHCSRRISQGLFLKVFLPQAYSYNINDIRRQLNALLKSSISVPSLKSQRAFVPFEVDRASLVIEDSSQAGHFDVSFDLLTLQSCTVELYANVKTMFIAKAILPKSDADDAIDDNLMISDNAEYRSERRTFSQANAKIKVSFTGVNLCNTTTTVEDLPGTAIDATSSAPKSDMISVLRNIIIIVRPTTTADTSIAFDIRSNGKALSAGEYTTTDLQYWTTIFGQVQTPTRGEADISQPSTSDAKLQFITNFVRQYVKVKSAFYILEELFLANGTAGSRQKLDGEDDAQCVVCLSDPAQIIILPCRHLCVCLDCWKGTSNQPEPQPPAPISDTPSLSVSNEPALEMHSIISSNSAVTRSQFTQCPVCRSSVKSWVEMQQVSQWPKHFKNAVREDALM
jgi:hypothetical protein